MGGEAVERGRSGDWAYDRDEFARLQSLLIPMWPTMTLRRRDETRTLVVISSVSVDVPEHLHPVLPAYEERYLCFVLGLARGSETRVVYVTSQPMHPRMVDYFLELIPGLDREDLRRRLTPIAVCDWSPIPLTRKILDRPRLIRRLRQAIGDPERAVLMPFMTTPLEARLAVELGVPVYGPDPALARLGTKSGSREVFDAAGVPHPRGASGVRTVSGITDALADLVRQSPPDEAIVKLDESVGGLGNAVVDLRGVTGRKELDQRVRTLRPEDESLDADAFLDQFEELGGVVEERLRGERFHSPSAQLRASPEGGVEALSTHDQVLGGRTGQIYLGCRFPADEAYASAIGCHGLNIAEELARRGVIGRFGIDFVAARDGDGDWSVSAVEINLRNGGTTHPTLALLALTEGDYDTETGRFLVDGVPKHYVATDHMETPGLRALTPDDVLDIIDERGLSWDNESQTGLVFHMLSGIAVAGRVGVTCIADSAADADSLYQTVESILTDAAR